MRFRWRSVASKSTTARPGSIDVSAKPISVAITRGPAICVCWCRCRAGVGASAERRIFFGLRGGVVRPLRWTSAPGRVARNTQGVSGAC